MENNENQVVETVETENKPVDPVQKEAEELKKENERRETLRHKVVADFVIMCSEFLYQEFLKKLKEQEQKDSFFESMKE